MRILKVKLGNLTEQEVEDHLSKIGTYFVYVGATFFVLGYIICGLIHQGA